MDHEGIRGPRIGRARPGRGPPGPPAPERADVVRPLSGRGCRPPRVSLSLVVLEGPPAAGWGRRPGAGPRRPGGAALRDLPALAVAAQEQRRARVRVGHPRARWHAGHEHPGLERQGHRRRLGGRPAWRLAPRAARHCRGLRRPLRPAAPPGGPGGGHDRHQRHPGDGRGPDGRHRLRPGAFRKHGNPNVYAKMTRMAEPGRTQDEIEDDEQRFDDEGRRSIFSALWFRAILVVVVLGVVAAVAVPYVLEIANQPPAKPTVVARPDTAPPPAPIVPPSPPAETTPPQAPAAAPAPAMEKSTSAEKPPVADKAPAPEKAAPAPSRKADARTDAESTTSRPKATSPAPTMQGQGAYFVQVGAFKSENSAKRLATRLRELKYNVEQTAASGGANAAASAPAANAAPAGDKYDVYVMGSTAADINAKLGPKGLTSEPSAGGAVVKPSLPLRDAVALSKDLAVDGMKVQVRRAVGGAASASVSAAAKAAPGSDGLYRVRVGPFDDPTVATSTLRELQQRGYTPFIARAGR